MAQYKEGTYFGTITSQGFGESKEKGTPFFFIRFIPTAYQNPANPEPEPVAQQYERDIVWYLTDNTAEFCVRDLRSLGFEGTQFTQLDPESGEFHDFTGEDVRAYCKHEASKNGDGKTYERWNLSFNKAREVAPLDDKGKRRLDALFGKHLVGGTGFKTKPKANVATPKTPAAAPTGGDIPF